MGCPRETETMEPFTAWPSTSTERTKWRLLSAYSATVSGESRSLGYKLIPLRSIGLLTNFSWR